MAVFGFNPGPLNGKTVGGKAKLCQQLDIFTIAVVMVASIPGRFTDDCAWDMFQNPKI
jgi:hypothetical protein